MKYNKDELKKQSPKKRVYDCLVKLIRRNEGYTTIPQKNLAKCIKGVGRPTVLKMVEELEQEGKIIVERIPNGKRANHKTKYSLPVPYKIVVLEGTQNLAKDMKLIGLNTWSIGDRLDLIDMYLKSGMDIIPLIPKGKKRMFTDDSWNSVYQGKHTKILNFFATNKTANVGVRMWGSFIVVDIDCLPRWYEKMGGEMTDTLTSASGKPEREHQWYINHTGIKINYPQVFGGLADLICTNNLVMVLPPSIHPSGTRYSWTNLSDPVDAPDYILDLFKNKHNPGFRDLPKYSQTGTPVREGGHTLRLASPLRELPKIIDKSRNPEVSRHNMYFAVGRSWHKGGMPIDEVAQKLVNYNTDCCNPPKTDKELREIIRQIEYGTNRPDFKTQEHK